MKRVCAKTQRDEIAKFPLTLLLVAKQFAAALSYWMCCCLKNKLFLFDCLLLTLHRALNVARLRCKGGEI
tara:strand:- start:510 stop:719 length:210 start_codon:yes stop_codon:yes gene_type:complete